jgi:hypothetical protein
MRYLILVFVLIMLPSVRFFGRPFNEFCDGARLRFVNRMTAGDFDYGRAGALGHKLLGWRRNHLVLIGDQIPTWLGLPCCFFDRPSERLDTPAHLPSAIRFLSLSLSFVSEGSLG